MSRYRDAPIQTRGFPPGLPYIIANEAAERFSYYGMRAILIVFMTQYLTDAAGHPDHLGDTEAQAYFHLFVSVTYLTPIAGALLADGVLGKFRTILLLSLVYCTGHFALALDDTRAGLFLGQSLIALGAGGIKPCVSAHLGDQFCASNQGLLSRAYSWFYLSINVGAFISMLVTPWLLAHAGAQVAFGVPGLLMAFASWIFWSGRRHFAHIPPAGMAYVREAVSGAALSQLGGLVVIYLLIAVFWSLFDQTGSSWVLQSQKMDRWVLGTEILPSQIQAANPLLILLLVPTFNRVVYPALGRLSRVTPLRKIGLGMGLAALSFAVSAVLQQRIDDGNATSILWQLPAYVLLTSAEVMISITALEFAYTQAPLSMKSSVMALYMASVALGNVFTGAVNFLITTPNGGSLLSGTAYFAFFAGLMGATVLLFALYARGYREVVRLQPADGASSRDDDD
ncbi:MAG: POT family MFS transporter [Methylotetracoccus sp.]